MLHGSYLRVPSVWRFFLAVVAVHTVWLFRAFRSLSIYDLQPLPLPDDAAAFALGGLCWCRFHRPECRCCCFVPDDTFVMSSAPLSAARLAA